MSFENLVRKGKGRPLNSTNKVTAPLKEAVSNLVNDNWEQVQKDIQQMRPDLRVKLIFQLLDYVLPKQKSIDVTEVAAPKNEFTVVEVIYKSEDEVA
jgi:hypothetical protein